MLMDLVADFRRGECTVEKGLDLSFSEEWTLVERIDDGQHNELLQSICVDRETAREASLRKEDCHVFQCVSLLPLDDDTPKCEGTLVITKLELIFADDKVRPVFFLMLRYKSRGASSLGNTTECRKRVRVRRIICYHTKQILPRFHCI